MKVHEFSIILKDVPEITDEICDRLWEAGCDDSSPGSCDGVTTIPFHREAVSLQQAITSAIADIGSAGFMISRIETTETMVVDQFNKQLMTTQ